MPLVSIALQLDSVSLGLGIDVYGYPPYQSRWLDLQGAQYARVHTEGTVSQGSFQVQVRLEYFDLDGNLWASGILPRSDPMGATPKIVLGDWWEIDQDLINLGDARARVEYFGSGTGTRAINVYWVELQLLG